MAIQTYGTAPERVGKTTRTKKRKPKDDTSGGGLIKIPKKPRKGKK